jgi:RHS repeat-associated protein
MQPSENQKQINAHGKIGTPSLSLPKGGGAIKGLGETFQPQSFTGAAGLSIPFPLSAARALTPQVGLEYSSGGEQGVFGMGFSLSLPSITRKTSNGIPRYDDTDIFLWSGSELVPTLSPNEEQSWISTVRQRPGVDSSWCIAAYRPRIEGAFALIEHWLNLESQESYWRVVTADNVTSIYGRSAHARIADPENPSHIFRWLIEETHDAYGNKVHYQYKTENADGIKPDIFEAGRDHTANRYLEHIEYGNYLYEQQEHYAFNVVFDYGEYNLAAPDALPGLWLDRPDPFSSYRSGFEIRTNRLCRHILIYHRFQGEFGGAPFLVRALRFDYQEASSSSSEPSSFSDLTFLKRVTEIGFRKDESGTYQQRFLPPLELNYCEFDPVGQPYRLLRVADGGHIPGYLRESQYLPVDLYGEGLPGLLYSDPDTTLYWEPLGEGCYESPQYPAWMPREKNLQTNNYTLASLNGNGVLDLVINEPERSGFYRSTEDGPWEAYREFTSRPVDLVNSYRDMVDMTGDGRADLLIFEDDRIKFYASQGIGGYGDARSVMKQPDFPAVENNYEEEVLTFADMFGDGLQHRVRIRNGSVECWPNLGYGHFGRKVTLGQAPRFGETMSARRLFLADIDGTGTTDIVYVYDDHLLIYFNQSGNQFSAPLRIPLPAPYDNLTQVSFADVLGNGTSCLILTRAEPEVKHYYYDFCNDTKPYLLVEIDNNMGARTRVTYSSTVKQYLKDKKQGRPWVTKLFFPVHVVERVESYDELSQAKFVSLYKYHDGYYDPQEREFRGFGFVESWDTEDYETFTASSMNPGFPANAVNRQLHVAPVYTKTWYHTGAFIEANAISRQYEREYWRGDEQAFSLPEQTLSPDILKQGGDTIRQAYAAMEGQMLRQEVYGLDGSDEAQNPYQVQETSLRVRLIQPRKQNRYAVFYSYTQEALTYHYERNAADPRIGHNLTLAVDEYGNVRRSLSLSYPRRQTASPPIFPEQLALKAVLSVAEYVNHPATEQEPYRRLGINYESCSYEVGGLSIPINTSLQIEQLMRDLTAALQNPVAQEQAAPGDGPWSLLLTWDRSYYWNTDQTDALPLGEIDGKCLLHHQETAAFTPALIERAFGDKVTDGILESDGGYYQVDGYWWNRGLIQYYLTGPGAFSLPIRAENNFSDVTTDSALNVRTDVTYDQYKLLQESMSQYLTESQLNTVTALNDYQTLSPWQITDSNGNIMEVLFDPLGQVIATSIYGTVAGEPAGDDPLSDYQIKPATFEHVLQDPADYLQGATCYFYYDLCAWLERRQPACAVTLQREKHVRQLKPGVASEIQISLSYSDGYGRVIESKARTGPGMVIMRDPYGKIMGDEQNQLVRGAARERWIVTGRTVYNNKGNPAEQYQPYFSATPDYEDQTEITSDDLVPPPSITHYDALQRVIRTDTPKGFFSKVEFTPWETKSYDENDTVPDSVYYQSFIQAYDEFNAQYPATPNRAQAKAKQSLDNEYDALSKAAACYNTPAIAILDNAGRTFRSVVNNLGQVSEDAFTEIAEGSGYTSEEIWNELVAQGYLTTDGWVTQAFQPYTLGFTLVLDSGYQSLAGTITDYLKESCLTTLRVLDFQGRELISIDPRLFYTNLTEQTNYYNFKYLYDLNGTVLSGESADAGLRLSLNNIFGNSIHAWDSRNFHVAKTYDQLQRPLQVQVQWDDGQGNSGSWLTEQIIYGEGQVNDQANNLRGQVYQHYDQAGVVTNALYSLGGQAMTTTRQLRKDYKREVDWSGDVPLEKEVFTARTVYDALNRVVVQVAPDNSIHLPTYNEAGQLLKVEAILDTNALETDETVASTNANQSGLIVPGEGPRQTFVEHIAYDANGQRTRIRYGNGVETHYHYEPTTLRLLRLKTTRIEQGAKRLHLLQNIDYTYDPVGNITRTDDRSWETVFCYNQQVEPIADYTYDALYRLIQATGRQHPGLQAPTQRKDMYLREGRFIPACPPNPNDQKKLENYTEAYAYDDAGNLLQTRHSASQSWTRTINIAPDSNRGFPADSPKTVYDPNGNLLHLDHLRAIAWNYRNNIAKVVLIARQDEMQDDAEFYVYDSSGNRVRKVFERMKDQGRVTEIEEKIYLGWYEIKRIRTKTEGSRAAIMERRTLRIMDNAACVCIVHHWTRDVRKRETDKEGVRQFRYQLTNQLGSVAMEVDAEGQLISYEEYYPYGGTSFTAGANAVEVKLKEYRYSGQEQDAATGLYYYGMRYYAPWLGRWMSTDPAGTVDGLNLYAFVQGNPISARDVDGQMKGEVCGDSDHEQNSESCKGKPDTTSDSEEFTPVVDPSSFGVSNSIDDPLSLGAPSLPGVTPAIAKKSTYKKRNPILAPDTLDIRTGADWEQAYNLMNEHKVFTVKLHLNNNESRQGVVSQRYQAGEATNIFLEKGAGFPGLGNSTAYNNISTFATNGSRDPYLRLARRAIKGTLMTKGLPADATNPVYKSQAAMFVCLAMTSERGRGSYAPLVALIALGAAKKVPNANFLKSYIPAPAGGQEMIREFSHTIDTLLDDELPLEEGQALGNKYQSFFSNMGAYLKTKKNPDYDEMKELIGNDTETGSVLAFKQYIEYMQGKYPHL